MNIVTDIDDHRLSVAKSLGADHVIKVTTRDPEELANQVATVLGEKPDATLECSGTDFSTAAGIYVSGGGADDDRDDNVASHR